MERLQITHWSAIVVINNNCHNLSEYNGQRILGIFYDISSTLHYKAFSLFFRVFGISLCPFLYPRCNDAIIKYKIQTFNTIGFLPFRPPPLFFGFFGIFYNFRQANTLSQAEYELIVLKWTKFTLIFLLWNVEHLSYHPPCLFNLILQRN